MLKPEGILVFNDVAHRNVLIPRILFAVPSLLPFYGCILLLTIC